MDLNKFMPGEREPAPEGYSRMSKEEYAAAKRQEREEVWSEIDAQAKAVFKNGDVFSIADTGTNAKSGKVKHQTER